MISYRPLTSIRYWMVLLGSLALTGLVIGNAFQQKQQFYPSIVYLSKSTISLAVLHVQAFVLVILMGKILCRIFFGSLRETEVEHLMERGWYVLTETCLAFTVFRDDFTSRFVAMFTVLLLAKCFHWLLEDRIDIMERSLNISWKFHTRAITLIILLSVFDLAMIKAAYQITVAKGASAQLVFGFEYSILLISTWTICMKYIIHTVDLRTQSSLENKATYFLYMELIANGIKCVIYSAFMVIMIAIHTFPLFAIRPMYLALKSFKKAAYDVVMSRRAINYMNTMFQNADPSDVTDSLCAVCREEMTTNNLKKLPCNHVFHTHCLRSWFQRQQTCPTCRIDILRHESTLNMLNRPRRRLLRPGRGEQAGAGGAANAMGGGAAPTPGTAPSQVPSSSNVNPNLSSVPLSPTFLVPPPAFTPLPELNSLLQSLSDEELREMEGNQRRNVQARIECLTQIQTLLDAAVTQMNQYTALMAQMDDRIPNLAPGPSQEPGPSSSGKGVSKRSEPSSEVKLESSSSSSSPKLDDPTDQSELRKRRVSKLAGEGGSSASLSSSGNTQNEE